MYLPEVYFSKKYDKLFFETMDCDEFFSRINLSCPELLKGKSVWVCKKQIEKYLSHDRIFNKELEKDALTTKEYLISNGFNKDVYFIDLGWKGSIQDSLNIIFNDSYDEIVGFYIGMINTNDKKHGILFSNKKNYNLYFYIYQCFTKI